MLTCSAATKQNNGDKRRENSPSKVTTVSVGQGEPLGELINSYSQHRKGFFTHLYNFLAFRAVSFSPDRNLYNFELYGFQI
jgi:hypothetical protein